MVTTRVPQSGTPRTRAKDEARSPARRLRWAYSVPMTGVRYYRFLPDVTDTPDVPEHRNPFESDGPKIVRHTPGREHETSVRGGS